MSGRDVAFHPDAIAEAQNAVAWYRERSELASTRFARELEVAVLSIRETPQAWPPSSGGTRMFPLRRFPFLIHYRIVGDDRLEVLAVAHARRRPGYWRGR